MFFLLLFKVVRSTDFIKMQSLETKKQMIFALNMPDHLIAHQLGTPELVSEEDFQEFIEKLIQ